MMTITALVLFSSGPETPAGGVRPGYDFVLEDVPSVRPAPAPVPVNQIPDAARVQDAGGAGEDGDSEDASSSIDDNVEDQTGDSIDDEQRRPHNREPRPPPIPRDAAVPPRITLPQEFVRRLNEDADPSAILSRQTGGRLTEARATVMALQSLARVFNDLVSVERQCGDNCAAYAGAANNALTFLNNYRLQLHSICDSSRDMVEDARRHCDESSIRSMLASSPVLARLVGTDDAHPVQAFDCECNGRRVRR